MNRYSVYVVLVHYYILFVGVNEVNNLRIPELNITWLTTICGIDMHTQQHIPDAMTYSINHHGIIYTIICIS